jgi:cell division protein FtsL
MMFSKRRVSQRAEKRKRTKGKGLEIGLIVLFLCMILLDLLLVGFRIQSIEFRYRISRARQENKELKRINDKLRLEAAVLKSPARIADIAIREFGMESPSLEQLIVIR